MASAYKKTVKITDPQTGAVTVRKSKKWYVKYRDGDDIVRLKAGFKRTLAENVQDYASRLGGSPRTMD
jgi:hypothetical protein